MKHHAGMLMQLVVLSVLPVLVAFQLIYGFRLIVMPACLLVGIAMFGIGTWLRG